MIYPPTFVPLHGDLKWPPRETWRRITSRWSIHGAAGTWRGRQRWDSDEDAAWVPPPTPTPSPQPTQSLFIATPHTRHEGRGGGRGEGDGLFIISSFFELRQKEFQYKVRQRQACVLFFPLFSLAAAAVWYLRTGNPRDETNSFITNLTYPPSSLPFPRPPFLGDTAVAVHDLGKQIMQVWC